MLKNISCSFSIASLCKRKNGFKGVIKTDELLTKVIKLQK